MRKKSFAIYFLICGMLTLFAATGAFGSGKDVYTNKCCSCHKAGGDAPVFYPAKYAAIQWEKFFARRKHMRYQDISDQFSPYELQAVEEYLIDHAADSERPEAIGLGIQ